MHGGVNHARPCFKSEASFAKIATGIATRSTTIGDGTDARRGPGANSKGRKVRGWYPEAGRVILGSLSNLLQMNPPDAAEYIAQRE